MATRKKAEQLTETQIVENVDEKIEETNYTTGYRVNGTDIGAYSSDINVPSSVTSYLSSNAYFTLPGRHFTVKSSLSSGTDLYYFKYDYGGSNPILSGRWGYDSSWYYYNLISTKFKNTYFTNKLYCAYPKRFGSWGCDYALTSTSNTYTITYSDKKIYLKEGTGSAVAIGSGPILFLELQAGGGGGSTGDHNYGFPWVIWDLWSGAGGGAGGYCNIAVDLSRVTSDGLTLKIGGGGAGTTYGEGLWGGTGGETSMYFISTSRNSIKITASGGGGAKNAYDGYATAGTGGAYTANCNGYNVLTNLIANPASYYTDGLLYCQFVQGANGGGGSQCPGSYYVQNYGNNGGTVSTTVSNFGILSNNIASNRTACSYNYFKTSVCSCGGGGGGSNVWGGNATYGGQGGSGGGAGSDYSGMGTETIQSGNAGTQGSIRLHYNNWT